MSFYKSFQKQSAFIRHNMTPFRLPMLVQHSARRAMSKFFGINGMRLMDIALTYRCNLSCDHCSASVFEKKTPGELTIHELKTLAENALDMDFLSINLTGGEPLLRSDIYEISSLFNRNRLYLTIQSNMLLLTDDMAKKLVQHGVCCITTSLDSYEPSEHNKFRKMDFAYETTLRNIEIASKAGLSVMVGGTITHQNIHSEGLEKLIRLSNNAGAIFLYNLAVPCGAWAGKSEVCLTDEDRKRLEYLLSEYPMSSTDHEPGRNAKGCPAGAEKIYITAYGDVIPCPFIHVSFGNIRHEPLASIVKRMQMTDWFGKYQPICLAAEDISLHNQVFDQLNGRSLPCDFKDITVFSREIQSRPCLPNMQNMTLGEVDKEKADCIVCGCETSTVVAQGVDYIYRTSNDAFTMVRCSGCGHLYLQPRPKSTSASAIYPQNYYTVTDEASKTRFVNFFKEMVLLKRLDFFDFSRPGTSVLDCGCGDCSLLLALKRAYPHLDCTGVDLTFSQKTRDLCRHHGIKLVTLFLEEADLGAGCFDLVIMNQVVEHLWFPDKAIRAIVKSMKHNACISVSTINPSGYDRELLPAGKWGGYYFPRHLNLFSTDMLLKYFESFGLQAMSKRSLVAPVVWIHSCEALFSKHGKPTSRLSKIFFSANSALSLILFTVLDGLALLFGRVTSNQVIVFKKQ